MLYRARIAAARTRPFDVDLSGRGSIFVVSLATGAFLLYCWLRHPFIGQWDSFDYTWRAVRHQFSPLGLGRPVYSLINIAAWEMARPFGLKADQAWQALQVVPLVLAALGLAFQYRLVSRLAGAAAGRAASLLLALSPSYVVYSGYVMSEMPMLFFLMLALDLMHKGAIEGDRRLLVASSLALGLAVGTREQAAMLVPFLLFIMFNASGRLGRARALALASGPALVVVIGTASLAAALAEDYAGRFYRWFSVVAPVERFEPGRGLVVLAYAFAGSPVASGLCVAGAVDALKRRDRWYGGFLTLGVLLPLVALFFNPDSHLHPRYEMIALPALTAGAGMFAAQAAAQLEAREWRGLLILWLGSMLVLLIATAGFIQPARRQAQADREFVYLLARELPRGAVIIAGRQTPALHYLRGIGVRQDWRIISSGWDWPGQRLALQVRTGLEEGKRVYICGEARGWGGPEARDVAALAAEFVFVPVRARLYELVPKQ